MPFPDLRTGNPDGAGADREAAFDVLFRRHYRALCRFAGRIMGTDAEAEEVVQDIFALVWERHDVINESSPSRPYLYRAVHNAALNRVRHWRVEHRWAEGDGKAREEDGHVAPAEVLLEEQELALAVRRAIEQLPDRSRLVYTLSRQDQLTYAEIAATLGISVKTVETQMTRALKRLRLAVGPLLAGIVLLFS